MLRIVTLKRGLGNNNNIYYWASFLKSHFIYSYDLYSYFLSYNIEHTLSLGASFTSTDSSKVREFKVNWTHSAKGSLLLALNLKTLVKLDLSTLLDKWR
jgi:hypothetical protein